MYRIYADDTLIYDSTLEDYKIGKGQITREADKSGSFVFSVYPDHPYYSQFVRMKTVVTVYKSGRIVFRGRILDDATDYWNAKTLTCEGELGFLQDSVARPFDFKGTPADLFAQFIAEHNSQHKSRDEWKQFKVGTVTVVDNNESIDRSAGGYGTMWDTMQSALTGSALGGHFYITHGDDGTDPIPTLHYVADFPKQASQGIEFGVNLKDYTKKVSAADMATCIIPLGASNGSDGERLTIEDVNGGKDYIYDAAAVAMYGWIIKVVTWDDVTLANHLLTKGKAWLQSVVNQHATIELTALDMHLLDRSIESYNVCEYVRATSAPHGLDAVMLCSKQTMDLLKPDNDTVTLGYTFGTLTGATVQLGASVSTLGKTMSSIKQEADEIEATVQRQGESLTKLELLPGQLTLSVTNSQDGTSASIQLVAGTKEDGSPNTLGSPAEIKLTGLVTFESLGKDGTTQIDGGRITTGTIAAERLDLSGVATFSALSSEPGNNQTQINGGWIDADTLTVKAVKIVGEDNETLAEIIEGVIDADYIYALGITATELRGQIVTLSDEDGDTVGTLDLSFYDRKETVDLYSKEVLWLSGGSEVVMMVGDFDQFLSVGSDGAYASEDFYSQYGGSLGGAAMAWDTLYADSCSCCTSDENRKNSIEELPDKYLVMFDHLTPYRFKMNNGTSGRYHPGYTAQNVKAAMDIAGIESTEFGGWIMDVDKEGNEIYMLRYEEFGAIYAAKIKQLEARVASLEGTA